MATFKKNYLYSSSIEIVALIVYVYWDRPMNNSSQSLNIQASMRLEGHEPDRQTYTKFVQLFQSVVDKRLNISPYLPYNAQPTPLSPLKLRLLKKDWCPLPRTSFA